MSKAKQPNYSEAERMAIIKKNNTSEKIIESDSYDFTTELLNNWAQGKEIISVQRREVGTGSRKIYQAVIKWVDSRPRTDNRGVFF